MSSDVDPLDWTVDQVIACLCHSSSTPWCQSLSKAPRPDPATFELALRENLINGETLLNDVDKDALRQDLGLKALGHRSFVLAAIRYLRQASSKYRRANSLPNSLLDDRSQAASPSYFPSTAPFSAAGSPGTLVFSPRSLGDVAPPQQLAQSAFSNTVGFPTRFTDMEARTDCHVAGYPPTPSATLPTIERPMGVETSVSGAGGASKISQERKHTISQQTNIHDGAFKTPRLRAHEQYMVGNDGKKRRRLDFRLPIGSTTSGVALETSSSLTQKNGASWYIGPGRITPDELFYPILPDEDDSDNFTILSRELPRGHRLFVKQCLHYFYRQQPIHLSGANGGKRWAILPYKIPKTQNKKCHFTLFSSREGKVVVSQEEIAQWPQLSPRDEKSSDKSAPPSKPRDPYEYLLQKYPVKENDQDTYPLYGESGSEGEYDDDTWREIQEDHQQQSSVKERRLGTQEIEMVIDKCVKEYEDSWRKNHLPREEPKAWRIWSLARKNGNKNQQTKALLTDIGLLENRLMKIQKNIRLNEYAKVEELQSQCQSMEQTVLSIQSQKWRVSVLERETCPPRITFVPPKPKQPARRRSDSDGESLGSESDEVYDDDLDRFIEDDLSTVDQYKADESTPGDGVSRVDSIPLPSHARSYSSSSDSEFDAISPSGEKRKLFHKPRLPVPMRTFSAKKDTFPSRPSPRLEHAEVECIDLTRESPPPGADDFDITTPPLNPSRPSTGEPTGHIPKIERHSSSPTPFHLGQVDSLETLGASPNDNPESATKLPDGLDFKGLQRIDYSVLEDTGDRERILSKLMAGLPDEQRTRMIEYALPSPSDFQDKVSEALRKLLQHKRANRNLDDMENDILMRIASLYISWTNRVAVTKEGIPRTQIKNAIRRTKEFPGFTRALTTRLELLAKRSVRTGRMESRQRNSSTAAPFKPSDVDPDYDVPPASLHTPHKKRKREVKERQEVRQNHASAQLRAAIQEKQRKRLEERMESVGVSNDDPSLMAVTFETPIVYLDPHIGRRIKPHQLRGVQFMWRELIQDEKHQGCLLAHTMGLGKTMQVISLLVTISAAAASTDPDIRGQVPNRFHRSQTLILCPSSLIDNWYEEFLMWTPRTNWLGPLRKITSASAFGERIHELSAWDEEGGILIMSYDIFRMWVHNKETKTRGRPLEYEDHMRIKEQLLDGPNIIVADEAHKMKNRTTDIAAAASEFRSKSRIALTGSPLANNLIDYYAMVDWIAPGYLGDFIEFKANYVEPIEEGLYVDSTHAERRKSLKKLQVLKENLGPKIDRADISVLEGSLPPKVEFVITIPLTALQKEAYDMYVDSIRAGRSEVGTAKLWSWLAILSLCCNHPACFNNKLLTQSDNSRKQGPKSDDFDSGDLPGDESPIQAGLPETMITSQRELFAKVEDIKAPGLSHRAEILDQIIRESVRAGDKVLVFSHSLPTLDYIESMIKLSGISYRRLDGHTPIVSRQAATKKFNQSGSDQQVYLISTRAGGLGLNIPGANRVVIFDFSFSPTWEEQAVGRAYRLGQQKPVYVYRFIAGGSFEEVMYNKAVFKTQLSFRVVDKRNPIRWASKSAKEYLFPSKSVKMEDISGYIGKDPEVLDKIIQRDEHKTIRKIELTETFQREDNDRLTEEEKKDVREELDDEILKRNNPEAYHKRLRERQAAEAALRPPASTWGGYPSYAVPMLSQTQSSLGYTHPIQNDATHDPPPLEPDTSLLRSQPAPVPDTAAAKLFSTPAHTTSAEDSSLITLGPGASGTAQPSAQQHPVAKVVQSSSGNEALQNHILSTVTAAESDGTIKNAQSSRTPSPDPSNRAATSDCKQQ
ncbi:SNF2 family helicase/ATPase, putative [Paecilomyces variotii No. 5]|uniref:SNF2 family helicase/ATPase, putative n=1 Tax=Byssochlamys spectabilis (strain No. 5 / NBRC 109023) TaxID=1356009 RepID=V5FQR8_BYSSN|nr:SNF2 family helicase/ATPase, putative [Paecilomyces variotii No. 5]